MEIFHESATSAIIQMLPSFGTKHAHLVMGYCYLFGVTPFRLKAKKLRLLLEEMKRLFDAESFTFEKRQYGISHAGISEALDAMIKRNFARTLLNHNYLKQIMIGISEREGKAAGRIAEKKLLRREAALRDGDRPDEESGNNGEMMPHRVPVIPGEEREIPPEAKAEIDKIFGPGKVLNPQKTGRTP